MSACSADSSLFGPPTDGSVGHVSRGAQKAQTASQQSPGAASACEGLIELGSCDRVPRNNVEGDKDFSRRPRSKDNSFDIFPLIEGCSEDLDAFIFFFKQTSCTWMHKYNVGKSNDDAGLTYLLLVGLCDQLLLLLFLNFSVLVANPKKLPYTVAKRSNYQFREMVFRG